MATCKQCDVCGRIYSGVPVYRNMFAPKEVRSSTITIDDYDSINPEHLALEVCPVCMGRISDFIGQIATLSKLRGDRK